MKIQKIIFSVLILIIGFIIGIFVKSQILAQEMPQGSSISSQPAPLTPTQVFSLPQPSSTSQNLPVPPANPSDPSVSQHTFSSGGREDIVQIGNITSSPQEAYTGDDITFTVTIQNVAPYKKFVKQFCFNSDEGNFGCSPGFNLNPGQVFSISNSGKFTSSGEKSVGVSWTQDGVNFYSPVNATSGVVNIL